MVLLEGELHCRSLETSVQLREIGISRAGKVVALSDQDELGIYDSRSVHGLSDLRDARRRIIAIPPGRVVRGDVKAPNGFCIAFEEYTWVLKHLRDLAERSTVLGAERGRVAGREMECHREKQDRWRKIHRSRPKASCTSQEHRGARRRVGFLEPGPGQESKLFWVIVKDASVTC